MVPPPLWELRHNHRDGATGWRSGAGSWSTGVVRRAILALLLLTAGLWGCAYPYNVRNVGAEQTALYASVGGPLFDNLGAPIPIPAVVVGAQHGVTDFWDAHASLHVLAAVYKMAGIDAGSTLRLLRQRGGVPEVTGTFRLSLLTNFEDGARVYPELEAFASWLLRGRVLLFGGLNTFYDFFWHGGPRVHWGPCVGAEVQLGRRYALGIAVRWISPEASTDRLVVEYVTPGGQGTLAIQLGFKVYLGRRGNP